MYKTCACCKKLCSDTAHNVVVCNLTGTVVLSNRADDCEQFEELPAVERLDDDVVRKAIERNAGIADAMPPHAQRKCGWCEKCYEDDEWQGMSYITAATMTLPEAGLRISIVSSSRKASVSLNHCRLTPTFG